MKGEIFKSVYGGITWTSSWLSATGIAGLAVDPNNSAIIYAGTALNGVYKTTDGGKTWNPANYGIPALPDCP